jgi:hypothetical protein
MFVKSLLLTGLLVLGAFTASAQTYWSTNASLNCGSYGTDSLGTPLQLTSGPGAGGYVCYVYGTLPWYASGAGWGSTIRVSAPPTADVAYFFYFADVNGNDATLDFKYQGDSTVTSDTSASSALYANQPLQVDIYGLHSQAPNYGTTADGPVTVLVECPDSNTCQQAQAQLIYSALPSQPWSLSAPVIWDWQTSLAWSSVGVDDTATNTDPKTKNTVSFVIYNLDTTGKVSHTYTLNVYDSTGSLFSSGVTRAVPLYGSYADLVRNVVPNLPVGSFKLQVVSSGSTNWTAFEALQFHGPSATTLVAAAESVPASTGATTSSVAGRSRHPSPAAVPAMRSRADR